MKMGATEGFTVDLFRAPFRKPLLAKTKIEKRKSQASKRLHIVARPPLMGSLLFQQVWWNTPAQVAVRACIQRFFFIFSGFLWDSMQGANAGNDLCSQSDVNGKPEMSGKHIQNRAVN
jgi:hypothetical protein